MFNLAETTEPFESLFDLSTDETTIPQNLGAEINFLDGSFKEFVPESEDQLSTILDILNLEFHNQITNNQFKDALQTIQDNPHYLQQIHTIPMHHLDKFYLFLLRKQLRRINITRLENTPLLATYFSGNPIQVQVKNEQGNLETQTWQINLQESVVIFNILLTKHYHDLAKSVWENNTQLTSYICGETIQIQLPNDQGIPETQTRQITTQELINNFKSALSNKGYYVAESMWNITESPLKHALPTLNITQWTELTELVLSTYNRQTRTFIISFINAISNKGILENCLSTIETKKRSVCTRNQIAIIKSRLNALEPDITTSIGLSSSVANQSIFASTSTADELPNNKRSKTEEPSLDAQRLN